MTTETDARVFQQPQRHIEPEDNLSYNASIIDDEVLASCIEENWTFQERHDLKLDSWEYNRNGSDPGLVLIFNFENFKAHRRRNGTRRDVNEIIICLQKLGFNIRKNNIIHDGTTSQIKEKLFEVSKMDLSDKNCTMTFFLTHGAEQSILSTSDGTIQIKEILQYFNNNPTLEGKPKLFFLQACKGDEYSTTGKNLLGSKSTLIPGSSFGKHDNIGKDTLIVCSSLETQASFRNATKGTWFIQELCKVLTSHGRRDDILSLIMRTTKCVCGNYYNETDFYEKQMPVFISTLTKKFYLNRNKDRDLALRNCHFLNSLLENIGN